MSIIPRLMVLCALLFGLSYSSVYAGDCGDCAEKKSCKATCDRCCSQMGGISYCDSSAGRLVCGNGQYSSCYCTRHAVMDLQHIQGCCIWQGGVLSATAEGHVICNNGGVSEICSNFEFPQSLATW